MTVRMVHLPFNPSADLLSAPRYVNQFAKHQVKIKLVLYWVLTQAEWADPFVKGFQLQVGDSTSPKTPRTNRFL